MALLGSLKALALMHNLEDSLPYGKAQWLQMADELTLSLPLRQ